MHIDFFLLNHWQVEIYCSGNSLELDDFVLCEYTLHRFVLWRVRSINNVRCVEGEIFIRCLKC